MPEMDGLACMDQINKMENKPTVIMVSAMGQEAFVQEAIMNGAKGFIVKPYKPETVINLLNKFRT